MEPGLKADIETHVSQLKTTMEGNDIQAIKHSSEALMKASHKLAEQMYSKTGGAEGAAAGAAAGAAGAAGHEEKLPKKPEEEVVEAEFEEVK